MTNIDPTTRITDAERKKWAAEAEKAEGNDKNDGILLNSAFEKKYLELINQGWKPQQAREVLPLCAATEAVYTAFVEDWQHFFDLRYFGKTGAPHPNMVELAGLMAKEADKYGIWKELCNENIEVNDN